MFFRKVDEVSEVGEGGGLDGWYQSDLLVRGGEKANEAIAFHFLTTRSEIRPDSRIREKMTYWKVGSVR
jgi:hypothetical protein